MAALGLEIVSLVVIQYFATTLPPNAVSRYDDALYNVVQLLYVSAGLLMLFDPVEEPAPSPLPPWMLTFNPLPLLAITGVAALFLSEAARGDGPLEGVLALGLVALVALQTIRLLATVWENARLVRRGGAAGGEAGGAAPDLGRDLARVQQHAHGGDRPRGAGPVGGGAEQPGGPSAVQY